MTKTYEEWMEEEEYEQTEKETLAKRYNEGKRQLSYLTDFPNAMQGFAALCEFGASKYGRDNWKRGRGFKDTLDSLLRHTFAFASGEDIDPESGLPHTIHIIWNAAALEEWRTSHPELDDRNRT